MTSTESEKVRPVTVMLAAGGFTLVVLVTLVLLKHDLRYDTGELVLTPNGCTAVASHGVAVTPLEGESLCRVQGEFWFPSNTEKFGIARFDTPQGRIEIQLPGREVVSGAYR